MASQGYGKSGSWQVNEYGTEIIDIGVCRAGFQKVAQPFEKPRRIVVGKKGGGIEAELAGPRQRGFFDEGPCGVVGAAGAAIGSIGVPGDGANAWGALERLAHCH